ncbi:MAG: hypothetical protein K8T20_19810 [Planctomycetes bacterium]|nr:hypothetical protein [Planctomycetota bacterium]
MRHLLAFMLLAAVAAAESPSADFDSPDSAKAWSSEAGTPERVEAPAHGGSAALRWKAASDGAVLSFGGIRGDLTKSRALRFWIRIGGTVERDLVARVRAKGGLFWRKFAVRPDVWTEVVIPFYQFRPEGFPVWEKAEAFELLARRAGTVFLDDLAFVEGGERPQIEPSAALCERVFPDGNPAIALTDNFRVFTDAPVDAAAVAARLEEGLVRFRKVFAVEEPLGWPVTLIIRKSVEDYHRTAVDTAHDIYGGDIPAPAAGGLTFFDYSVTSLEEKYGALRPVFLHECCHQLVTRLLHVRGTNGASWLEEALCYFMQNEFLPIENAKEEALKLLDNPKRPALATFDGKQKIDSGAENLTAFLLSRWLLSDPHAAHWPEVLAALRENNLAILPAVEEALGLKAEDAVKDFEDFTRTWATSK